MICYLSIRCDGEWVTKSDGAGDTNIEAEKGGISDALKRAAQKFGIGRYLYYLPKKLRLITCHAGLFLMTYRAESGHWYDQDGNPAYTTVARMAKSATPR